MKKIQLIGISTLMILLIISLPICFAQEINLVMDANGNLITGDGKFRVYNSLNQLWKVYNGSTTTLLLEEYVYHPVEEWILIKKVYNNNSAWKETVYYVDENFVRVVNSSGSYDFTYVYHEGQLVAQLNPDSSKIYIHGNHEGSSSVVTNSSGAVIENTSYTPFGKIISGGTKTRYGYEAQEFDSVVGDTDFHFRKYKADWSLFTQPDTLIQNVYDPQMLNRYSFERNNGYRYIDINGHSLFAIFAVIAIVIAVVAIVISDFRHVEPPNSAKTKSSKTGTQASSTSIKPNSNTANKNLAEDVKTSAKETAGTAILDLGSKSISKSGSQQIAKMTGSNAAPKILSTTGKLASVGFTIAFAILDTAKSIGILEEYSDEEFNEKVPKYANKRMNDLRKLLVGWAEFHALKSPILTLG